jgi:hypothetical protein
MVVWYEPMQLLRTGLSVAISTILERNSDQRIVEALETDSIEYFDYSVDDAKQRRRELWLDYVADAGDGFNSTYAVASAVGRETLPLKDPNSVTHVTQRGRVRLAAQVAARAAASVCGRASGGRVAMSSPSAVTGSPISLPRAM